MCELVWGRVRLGVLGELLDAVKFLDAVELVDVSGDGWGVFGIHVLRRVGVLGELLDAVKFLDAVELVDVSGDGWGVFGIHVLRRGGRTSQNRLSDNTVPLFFGRPARAGRTLTVKGLIISVRSGRRLGKSRSSSMPSSSSGGKRDRLTADAGAGLGAGVVVRAGLCD